MLQCCNPYRLDLKPFVKDKYEKKKFLRSEASKKADGICVGCGKCLFCRIRLARERFARSLFETLSAVRTLFVTLTYSEDKVWRHAISGEREHNYGHFQDFMKRLRINLVRSGYNINVRYVCVGEKGENFTKRPHFHVIFFGLGKEHAGLLFSSWNKGIVDIGYTTTNSIAYTANYQLKSLKDTVFTSKSIIYRSSVKLGHGVIDYLFNLFKQHGLQYFVKLGKEKVKIPRTIINKLVTMDSDFFIQHWRNKRRYFEDNKAFFDVVDMEEYKKQMYSQAEAILDEMKKRLILKNLNKGIKHEAFNIRPHKIQAIHL